jgi:putative ABC transport system permease protein
MLFQMALKNVFRNKKRTLITLIAVFFGVFLSVLANGLNKGLEWQIANMYIKTETSSLKIVNHGYKIDDLTNPIDYPLTKFEPITKALSDNPKVRAFSPRISFHGSLSNGVNELRSLGLGVDPVREDAVFNRSQGIVSGGFLKSGDEGIVIGADLAQLLGLKVGDTVTVIAQAAQMGMNAYDLEIKGLVRTGNPVLDRGTFWVPVGFAADLLSFTGITDIPVALRDNSQIKLFTADFARLTFSETPQVLTWQDFTKDFVQLVEFRGRLINILTAMILLMAAAGIANTMLMAMMERKREIGNLMALGVRRGEIISLFLVEGSMIGFLGSAVAAILGSGVVYYFQVNGISLGTRISNALGDIPIAGKLFAYLDWTHVLAYFLMGLAVSVVSTVYPAMKSARLKPVEAIRGTGGKQG